MVPKLILALNNDQPDQSALEAIDIIIRELAYINDVAFLSHEALFKSTSSLINIVNISKNYFDEIIVVGYSRRQSDFLKSAYGQWHFRSAERTKEVWNVVLDAGLNPNLFTGVERFFIAAVYSDMNTARQLDGSNLLYWGSKYVEIKRLLSQFNVALSVGYIPNQSFKFSLVEDFYSRSGAMQQNTVKTHDLRANTQFCPIVIEAANSAVANGFSVPGPHDHNEFFESLRLSKGAPNEGDDYLVEQIKNYVDSFFREENSLFCNFFGLDEQYFAPKSVISKSDVDRLIRLYSDGMHCDPLRSINRGRNISNLLFSHIFESYVRQSKALG